MRVPGSKVYRAFSELDPFSDAECVAYVRMVRQRHRLMHGVATVFGVGLALGCIVGFGSLMVSFTASIDDQPGRSVFDSAWGTLLLLLLIVAVPVMTGGVAFLVVRDVALRRGVRRHLGKVQCHGCGYSLLGLAVVDGVVRCPECGEGLELAKYGLSEGDVLAGAR